MKTVLMLFICLTFVSTDAHAQRLEHNRNEDIASYVLASAINDCEEGIGSSASEVVLAAVKSSMDFETMKPSETASELIQNLRYSVQEQLVGLCTKLKVLGKAGYAVKR